jgi:tetratricopeptide (TPR) repeat protein
MTLLMTCTNYLRFKLKAQLTAFYTLTIVLVLVLLPACSTLPEKQTPETLETLGKALTDLVDVPTANGKLSTDEGGMITTAEIKRNRYLEQKQERLANVPAYVIAKYKQALTLMKNKQWRKAEVLFNQVLMAQPQLAGAYVNKALIALQKKEFNRANKQLDKALAVNPINPYAYQIKARIARLNGHFDQAENSYLKALAIWPEYPEAQLNLAILLELYRGRLLDARKYYMSYLLLQWDDKQVQRWLAGVEIKIKRAGLVLPEKAGDNLSPKAKSKKAEAD